MDKCGDKYVMVKRKLHLFILFLILQVASFSFACTAYDSIKALTPSYEYGEKKSCALILLLCYWACCCIVTDEPDLSLLTIYIYYKLFPLLHNTFTWGLFQFNADVSMQIVHAQTNNNYLRHKYMHSFSVACIVVASVAFRWTLLFLSVMAE